MKPFFVVAVSDASLSTKITATYENIHFNQCIHLILEKVFMKITQADGKPVDIGETVRDACTKQSFIITNDNVRKY